MKKQIIRFFSLLMLAVLLVTAFAMQVNARVVFSDLAPTHWCYNKIIDFESKGYVCGYEDGTFKADQTITRAEYVKIVNNFFGYKPNTEKVANFSDVNSGDWFAPYVNEAVERGYITGFEDGTFRPQDPIRRQEATVILARILGIDKEVYPANHIDGLAQYSDSDEVQDWARVAIHSYSVYNFINGYTDGTLKILQNVTRAETVELLHVLEQKIIIDRKPGGSSKSTVKMPTIALYRFDKEANEFAAIKSSDLKSNWVNKAISTLSEDEYGVLVNVTSTTTGSTINEKLTGNKTGERKYITSKIEELTNAIFLTDGEYKISAFASKSGYHSSSSADKTILVDTKAPVVSGEVVTTLPVAHEQQVKVTVADPEASDVNRVSGLDTAKVRYAWFRYLGDGIYERATEWQNVTLDENGNAVITTEGLEYGTYKLAISAYDIAENAYGSEVDTVVTTSGDEEFREEVPYDFVEELEKEGEEKPEDPDITVIVGNNTPEVKDLVMRTEVNVEVSGKIVATDKDGDTLTYVLVENSGDSEYATVSGDTTSFEHGTAGTYYYNVEVSDGNGGTATVLVTVYVYDVKVVTPSGDKEDPVDYDVLADDLILYVGETKDVTASTTPKNEDATFEWNENSEEIEIVDDSQNNVTVIVEGKVPGKTTMNVTVKVGEVEITRTINVIVKGRKLTIHYVYEDGTIASEDKIIEEVGKDGYRITSPAVEGYTPDVAVVEGPMLTEDTEITVKYKANTDTKYTVEYYTEDLDGKGYTKVDSKKETGTTGEQVSIDTSVTFTGFTFDSNNDKNVLSGEVAGNGSLVLKAYYTRNNYKLSLVAGDNIARVSGEGTYKYEEEVTIDATLKDDAGYSYEFANWKSGDEEYSTGKNTTVTMPANDLTLTANATRIANTDTKYTVEYYTENLDGKGYTRVDSKEETGTTGEQVSIDTSVTFTGFTFDNDNENNVLSDDVAGDGSLVLKAYYTRNSYKLSLVAGDNIASVTGEGTYKYEEEVTIDATLKDDAGYSYEFANWKSGDEEYSTGKNTTVTMPANDLTLTANATRIANTDTKYTVEYYTEDLTEGNYTRVDSKEETGTTGEQVSIDTSRTFTGFTFDNDNENNVLSGEVAGNGSLVLKAYYTRNSYKLTLVAGKNVASVTGGGMHKYEEEVTIDATMKDEAGYSYSFENWKSGDAEYSTSKNAKVTMPANDLTLTANAIRTANTDTKYTVEYYTEDLDGKGYTKVDSKKETGTTGEQVSIDTSVTFTGFTFDSNNDKNVLSGEVAGNGSLVLKAYYTRNSYKLTLIAGDNVASVSGAGTYKYGQDVAISAVLEEIDGYTVTFDKWKANGGDDVDGQNTTITMPASDLTLTAIAKKTEKDPNVTIDIVADYPNNNKQAEPGDTIKYVATIENEESHEIKVKIDVDSDAADTIDSIIVYDKDGNLVKRYDNLDEEIVIPAGGNVKISYSSVVPKDCPVNEDKFTSTVTVSTVAGSLIKKETKSNSIEKSSDVLDATRKDKNVILILDLSGSMDENTKDGRTTKIAALRTAARQFVDKLYASSKETNTRVTLNVIGIGEAHDRSGFFGIGAYTSPSKKNGKGDPILLDDRYNGCDAYLIGSYINTNQGTWISSSLIKSKLKPDGGTNIVGSLKLANGIMDETYGQANGINDYIKGADNYVVILTDGANGPSANKPISKDTDGLKYSTALRNSGAGIYAIYFEGNDPEANEIGKTDLNTILDGKYPLYEASSSDSLNMAFDSIASSINKVQSNKGIITAVLPDTGAYFPIIVTYTENGEEKELFKVTKKSELEDRKMKVTSDGKSLEWDLTGTDYSELEGLKLKLTLGANATDGEETQSTLELLLTESGDLSSVTLVVNTENEENISEDSDVEKDDEIVSSGDVKVEEEPKVEEKNEEQQKEPKAEEKNEEQQKEPKVEEKNEEQQEEPKTEEKNEEQQKEPKAEEKNEEQQEEPKVEENNEEQQEDPKTEEKNEEQQEEPKVEEKNEEQQEEPKAEEKNEEQQEESKVEENKDEEQEEPKAEEKNEQQQEIKIEEEKKDEIIAVEPQVPSTEPQKTSTDKDDEQE